MRKHLLFTLPLLSLLLACSSEKSKEDHAKSKSTELAVIKSEVERETDSSAPILKWDISLTTKQKLYDAIASNEDLDVSLLSYLEEYEELENELNAELYNLRNYNSLNTLTSSETSKISSQALELKKQAQQNGFSIAQAEGMIYLHATTSGIKTNVIDKLNPPHSDFLELYCTEMDNKCCADGAIVIAETELAKRAWQWGELLEEVMGLAYKTIVSDEYEKYLSFIFMGIDNTPAFEWQSGKFKQSLFDAMIDTIEKYPESKAAAEFKTYTELLTAEGLKRTNKVEKFLNARFNQ